MPLEWHDRHAASDIGDAEERALARRICADRKPYFMRYIYPDLSKQYNKYIKNTNMNALRLFGKSVDELKATPYEDMTERECEFMHYYDLKMPVGLGSCVMNTICRKIENAFDGYVSNASSADKFDYEIYKSGEMYTQRQYQAVKKLMVEYDSRLKNLKIATKYGVVDVDDSTDKMSWMEEDFRRDCYSVCSNEKVLCNILLDLCYLKSSSRRFAWNMCSQTIIDNLLERNDWIIAFPKKSTDGDIDYCGQKYKMIQTRLEV